MTTKRSLIEVLSPEGHSDDVFALFRIRPVVVDTSSLLPDVLSCSRYLVESVFLDSVDFGLLRPFAAHHVWAEVPRKIPAMAEKAGIDRALVEAVWWNDYVPRIRFVDVAGLPVPRSSEIYRRDASDTPTFALAGLLDPVVVLASDRDLRDLGIAASDWIALVRAGEEITFTASGALGGLFGLRLGGYSIMATGRGLARVAQHSVAQVALGAGAMFALVTLPRWWPRVRQRLPEVGRQIGSLIDSITPLVEAITEQYQDATSVWNDSAFSQRGSSLLQNAARVLAASPVPLSRTQMVRALVPNDGERTRRVLMRQLDAVLSTHAAFVPVNKVRWQLGRAGLDFGVGDIDDEFLANRNRAPQALILKQKAESVRKRVSEGGFAGPEVSTEQIAGL